MYTNKQAIDCIYQYSKHYGNALYKCEDLYVEGEGEILLLIFFNVLENCIKFANENYDDRFVDSINKLSNILVEDEIKYLHLLREYRNKYAHANIESSYIIIDDIMYILSEDDTAIKLYELFSNKTYNLMVKILENRQMNVEK